MPVVSYTITCTQNTLVAKDVYEIRFTKPEGFTYKAGQFVLFDVPLVENPLDIQPRAYSISSAPHEPDLLFIIKLTPGGRTSRWIVETLREGTQVLMKGPFGNFVLHPESPKDYLFIATGTGMAPFRSQVLESIAAGDSRRIDIVFGVRNEGDLFWTEELDRLAQENPNIFLHYALSQPSESWTGHRGRVQSLIAQIITDFSMKKVYACGSPVMTKEIKQMALEQWGMGKQDVHVEGYI
jgi:CDP-4-dehydro-6-deoxyglucose reductase, E3